MRIYNLLSRFCAAGLAVMFAALLLTMTAFCETVQTQTKTSSAVTTGGEDKLSLLIGFVLLTVGTVGFIILKIKEKADNG